MLYPPATIRVSIDSVTALAGSVPKTNPDEVAIIPPAIETTHVAYAGLAPNRLAIAKASRGPTTSKANAPGNVTMTTARGATSAAETISPWSTPTDGRARTLS